MPVSVFNASEIILSEAVNVLSTFYIIMLATKIWQPIN